MLNKPCSPEGCKAEKRIQRYSALIMARELRTVSCISQGQITNYKKTNPLFLLTKLKMTFWSSHLTEAPLPKSLIKSRLSQRGPRSPDFLMSPFLPVSCRGALTTWLGVRRRVLSQSSLRRVFSKAGLLRAGLPPSAISISPLSHTKFPGRF